MIVSSGRPLAIIFLVGLMTACAVQAPCRTFAPAEDTTAVLHNPDMGWVVYENYPIDQRPNGSSNIAVLPSETFPDADEVALMFSWADIEKTKGIYDFSKVDRPYDWWKTRGKRIQLRMSTESLLFWSQLDPRSGTGIPGYVLAALPSDKKQLRSFEQFTYSVVDARDPFYQSRLREFLRAVDAHFRTRPVTLIDLRGFGLWGEWHSGYRYATPRDRIAALRSIIDCWSTELKDHTLAVSFSYDPDSPPSYYAGPNNRLDPAYTKTYADYLRYSAFDYAITKPNITLRRDGVGGAVHSNERLLDEVAFSSLGKGPIVAEFLGSYQQAKKAGKDWLQWMIDDALSIHPNYINLLGWQTTEARDFCREQPELVRYGLRNMGYRLVPVTITLPDAVRASSDCHIAMKWVNRAVGRPVHNYLLCVSLATSARGKQEVRRYNLGSVPTSKWVKGRTYAIDKRMPIGPIRPGTYELHLALLDPVTRESIHLPLKSALPDGSYKVGAVQVLRAQRR
jgi:hypothetical protein